MIEFIDIDDPRFRAFLWVSIRHRLGGVAAERFDAALATMPGSFRNAVRIEADAHVNQRCAWDLSDQIATILEHGGMILSNSNGVEFVHDRSDAAYEAEGWIAARCGVHAADDESLDDELRILAELLRDARLSPGNVVPFGGARR